jgi:hypothetical protein
MRPIPRPVRWFLLPLSLWVFACGAPAAPAAAPGKPAPEAPAKAPAPEAPAAPFATPTAKPPPPPAGVALLDPPLYVQRCDAAAPCMALLQPAGEAHCRGLTLGGLTGWRLPDRAEVARFARGTGADLERLEGFHWTRTAYEEDSKQAWIVDPKTGQETTIPRDRKPFTIRCVIEP